MQKERKRRRGGDAWITHRTCNNISCMHIMEMQVDISTTQHRYAHDANIWWGHSATMDDKRDMTKQRQEKQRQTKQTQKETHKEENHLE